MRIFSLLFFIPFVLLKNNCSFSFKNDVSALSFVYPVGTVIEDDHEKIILMYQNKKQLLSVFLWDPITKKAQKALSQCYTPAGVVSLSDKCGFSFIDNDCLRIKKINKRSPFTIHLYGPYDITIIHWIDNETCYFGAMEMGHEVLFCATTLGQLYRLTTKISCDYLYPSKIDDEIFCVIRQNERQKQSFSFASFYFEPLIVQDDDEQSIIFEKDPKNYKELFIFPHNTTPIFLCMESKQEGYCVCYHQNDVKQDYIIFTYSMLKKQAQEWVLQDLFCFKLPRHLITHEKPHCEGNSLYESIFPLLPKKIGDVIYFSSLENNESNQEYSNLYAYQCSGACISLLNFATDQRSLLFSPCRFSSGCVYYGYSCYEELFEYYDEQGEYFFELPQAQC